MTKTDPKNNIQKSYSAYGKVLGLLIQAIILMTFFALVGNWADKYFEHKVKFLTIVGVFIGMAIGFYNLIKNSLKEK